MCKFESKEASDSQCFHNKTDCAGSRKLVGRGAVCGTLPARARRGLGGVVRGTLGLAFV